MAKTYDTYKDSGIAWIGEIPGEWEVLPHKRVMKKIKEIQEHYQGEDIISLTINGVIIRDLEAGGKMPTTFDGYQKVHPGNLLLCLFDIDVTPRCVGLIKNEGVSSPAYSQFEMLPKAESSYYDYLLRYMDDNKTLLHLSKNLRSSLTESDFGQISTILPPLSVQQSISSFLDTKCGEIDSLISIQEEMISELLAYKQSVITEAVTKGLDKKAKMKNSGVEWIGDIPEEWEKDKIFRVFSVIGSGTTPKATDDSNFDGNINWIQSGDINGGKMFECKNKISENVLNQYSTLKIYKAPFIIVAMYGASVGNISISNIDGCVNQACCVMSNSNQCFNYLFYAIKAAKDYLIYRAEGGGQPNISQDKLKNLWLPLPPLPVQQAIATYLDEKTSQIDSLIALKQSKIESLKEYKKSIIYEYVTGKKRV